MCVALSLSPALGEHYRKHLCLARGEEKQLPFQYKPPGFVVVSQGCVVVDGRQTGHFLSHLLHTTEKPELHLADLTAVCGAMDLVDQSSRGGQELKHAKLTKYRVSLRNQKATDHIVFKNYFL